NIAAMITELDSDPAKQKKVFVISVENTDPQTMQTILQGLFPSDTYGNSRQGQFGNAFGNRGGLGNQGIGRGNNTGRGNGGGGFGGGNGFGGGGGLGGGGFGGGAGNF